MTSRSTVDVSVADVTKHFTVYLPIGTQFSDSPKCFRTYLWLVVL